MTQAVIDYRFVRRVIDNPKNTIEHATAISNLIYQYGRKHNYNDLYRMLWLSSSVALL